MSCLTAATSYDIERFSRLVSYAPSRDAKGVAFKSGEELLAMALYDHWAWNSVQVHLYSSGPRYLFDKGFRNAVFEYPFVQGQRGVLITVTPEDATASLAISRAFGFKEIFRIRDGWKVGISMVVKEFRKENWKRR